MGQPVTESTEHAAARLLLERSELEAQIRSVCKEIAYLKGQRDACSSAVTLKTVRRPAETGRGKTWPSFSTILRGLFHHILTSGTFGSLARTVSKSRLDAR